MSQPPLPAADEHALAVLARAGDPAAREALITSGLRSVALRARMLGLSGEELRDAVQSGTIGLIRAVDRFDPDRGVRLATYAWRWIGAEMAHGIRRPALLEIVDVPANDPVVGETDLLDALPGLAAEVLRRRYGLSVGRPSGQSRPAVADQLGLTVSQVRTIEGKAMRQLRRGLANVVDRAPLQGGADPP